MTKIAVIYGFSEGPNHAKHFFNALRQSKYELTNDVAAADIIIAHSGGCLMVPKQNKASLIVMAAGTVGPATGKPITTQLRKMGRDVKHRGLWHVIASNVPNAINLLRHPKRNWQMFSRIEDAKQLPKFNGRAAFISYHRDPWSETLDPADVARHPNWVFLQHSGDHDDLWEHPKEYLHLLQFLM